MIQCKLEKKKASSTLICTDLTTDRRLGLWSGLKWHPLEEISLKWELKEYWGLSHVKCEHLMTSGIWRTSHVTSLDTGCWRTWPDKERCYIWSDKTCDRANATSCSGGRALNWGLMERGLMKRNVTWLAMSLEDSADRSKISTPPLHSWAQITDLMTRDSQLFGGRRSSEEMI